MFKVCELSEVANFVLEWLGKGVEHGTTIFLTGVSFIEYVPSFVRFYFRLVMYNKTYMFIDV